MSPCRVLLCNIVEMCLLFDFTKMIDLSPLQKFRTKLLEFPVWQPYRNVIVGFYKNGRLGNVGIISV